MVPQSVGTVKILPVLPVIDENSGMFSDTSPNGFDVNESVNQCLGFLGVGKVGRSADHWSGSRGMNAFDHSDERVFEFCTPVLANQAICKPTDDGDDIRFQKGEAGLQAMLRVNNSGARMCRIDEDVGRAVEIGLRPIGDDAGECDRRFGSRTKVRIASEDPGHR